MLGVNYTNKRPLSIFSIYRIDKSGQFNFDSGTKDCNSLYMFTSPKGYFLFLCLVGSTISYLLFGELVGGTVLPFTRVTSVLLGCPPLAPTSLT